MSNVMDNMTDKEKEAAMGFSLSQKSALEAAGLSKKEIAELHANRVAENIAKERTRLDKMEQRLGRNKSGESLASSLVDMLEGKTSLTESDPSLTSQFLQLIQKGTGLSSPSSQNGIGKPWEGRTDLIMSNADFWKEMFAKGITELPDPEKFEKMTDEEADKAMAAYYASINAVDKEDIFERRRLGYFKAMEEWVRNGKKGDPPESIESIYELSIPML